MSFSKKIMSMPVLGLMGLGLSTTGLAQTDDCTGKGFLNCKSQTGFYIGAQAGLAQSLYTTADMENAYKAKNVDISVSKFNKNTLAGGAFLGFQLNRYIALEAGYLNLGVHDVTVSNNGDPLTGSQSNAIADIYPISAQGGSIGALLSFPLHENVKLGAKGGYYGWTSEHNTTGASADKAKHNQTGSGVWFGGEAAFWVSDPVQFYASASRFDLSGQVKFTYDAGLRIFFAKSGEPEEVFVEPVVTIEPPKPVEPPKDPDLDKDGVINEKDECPNTDPQYLVDEKGCDVMEVQWHEFSLVIRFDKGSDQIHEVYDEKIRDLAAFIAKYDVKSLTIFGHTSAVGSAEANQRLSEKRAKAMSYKLVMDYGVNGSVLKPVGMGESQLLDKANNNQAHALNRRIELSIKESILLPKKR